MEAAALNQADFKIQLPSSVFFFFSPSTLLESLSAVSPGGPSPWWSGGYNVGITVGSWRGIKLLGVIKLLLARCWEFLNMGESMFASQRD